MAQPELELPADAAYVFAYRLELGHGHPRGLTLKSLAELALEDAHDSGPTPDGRTRIDGFYVPPWAQQAIVIAAASTDTPTAVDRFVASKLTLKHFAIYSLGGHLCISTGDGAGSTLISFEPPDLADGSLTEIKPTKLSSNGVTMSHQVARMASRLLNA